MKGREDYWPFMVGLYLGGIVTFPFVLAPFFPLPRAQLLGLSLLMCFILGFARTRDGKFVMSRFIGALALVILLSAVGRNPVLVIPGLIPFFLAEFYGRIGVFVARALGISARLVTIDPTILYTFESTEPPAQKESTERPAHKADHEHPTYYLNEDGYQYLLDRTFRTWRSGDALIQKDAFREWMRGKSIKEFKKLFKRHRRTIEFVFTNFPIGHEEYLINVETSGEATSLVLTNQYLYFFSLDPNGMVTKFGNGRIALEEIKTCEAIKGILFYKAKLHLQSGGNLEIIEIPTRFTIDLVTSTLGRLREHAG